MYYICIMENNNEYFRIHAWLIYNHGKATKCENENCKSVNPKRYEWALLKGEDYKKDRNNFIQLCPSCHRKYDFTEEQRSKQSKAAKGRVFSKQTRKKISLAGKGKGTVPVIQKKDGVLIKEFLSVSDAANKTKILQSAISNTLTNRTKTAGGFTWHYKQMN